MAGSIGKSNWVGWLGPGWLLIENLIYDCFSLGHIIIIIVVVIEALPHVSVVIYVSSTSLLVPSYFLGLGSS